MKIRLIVLIVFILVGHALGGHRDYVEFEETYQVKGKTFSVEIEVDGGKVEIVKNRSDDECHIYLKYSKENCEREISFNRHQNHLEIYLDHEWGSRENKDDSDFTELVVALPSEPDIDLSVEVKAGEIDFELGDLHLKKFSLRNWAGDITLAFDQPNRTVLESFNVDVKIGEVKIFQLGNANFEEADINGGIGELTIDFQGEKFNRGKAYIDLDIGETTLIVPDDVGTKLKVSKFLFLSDVDYPDWFDRRGKYYYSSNYDESDDKLNLVISTGIGELKLRVK